MNKKDQELISSLYIENVDQKFEDYDEDYDYEDANKFESFYDTEAYEELTEMYEYLRKLSAANNKNSGLYRDELIERWYAVTAEYTQKIEDIPANYWDSEYYKGKFLYGLNLIK